MVKFISPMDIVEQEQRVVNFVGESKFESKYNDFLSRKSNLGSEEKRRYSVWQLDSPHPLIRIMWETRKAYRENLLNEDIEFNGSMIDVDILGNAIKTLRGAEIVDIENEPVDSSLEDVFVHKLWDEDEIWDAVFEMEAAAIYKKRGYDVKLIEENHKGGADFLIDDFGEPIRFESKRKEPKTKEEEEWEDMKKEIIEGIVGELDLSDNHFALKISSDEDLEKEMTTDIARESVELIKNGNSEEISFKGGGKEIHVELQSHDSGPKTKASSQRGVDALSHLEFDIDTTNSDYFHFEAQVKKKEDGDFLVDNAFIIGFDFPKYVDYTDKVMNSAKRARKQLSGRPPAVIYIDVPYHKVERMSELSTYFREEEMSQINRMEDRIEKRLLNTSDTINAVIISSRVKSTSDGKAGTVRRAKVHQNIGPEKELPEEFEFLFKKDEK